MNIHVAPNVKPGGKELSSRLAAAQARKRVAFLAAPWKRRAERDL
jgi:hypothetical protein